METWGQAIPLKLEQICLVQTVEPTCLKVRVKIFKNSKVPELAALKNTFWGLVQE